MSPLEVMLWLEVGVVAMLLVAAGVCFYKFLRGGNDG